MDKETLEKLGATVTEVSVSVKRAAWGDNASESHEYGMSANIAPDADPETVIKGLEGVLEGLFPEVKPREQASSVAQSDAPKAGEGGTEEIGKARLLVEPTDKGQVYKLELYSTNTALEFPVIYFNAYTKEAMEAMISPVLTKEWDGTPLQATVNWLADFKYSEKVSKKGNPYKDLVSLRKAD